MPELKRRIQPERGLQSALRWWERHFPKVAVSALRFFLTLASVLNRIKSKAKLIGPKQMRPRKRPARKASVTVVIPVLNEWRTIGKVVKFALRDPRVAEVLVVDDGSIDGTPERAERAGARVVTSSLLGKGASMEDGLQAANTEFLLYLDGDLRGLRSDLIQRMTRPLFAEKADFVKARFARRAGRVTLLTARPLLRTYFPELADFLQPLGGIIAARRSFLQQLRFENDYGVDIGLFIDAAAARARIVEVDIGRIEHESQSLEALGEMATQVARTILERAAEWGRLRLSHMRAAKERDRMQRADFRHALNMLKRAEKLALFDMDGTLLNGRFVLELAHSTGRMELLSPLLDNLTLDEVRRARRIAAIFAGVPKATMEQEAKQVPLMPGAVETVVGLRKAGYLDETASSQLVQGEIARVSSALRPLGNADDIRTTGKLKKMFGGKGGDAGMGTVSVKTQPKGAQVAVNQHLLEKTTPVEFLLDPGNYIIDITLSGYAPIHKVITVDRSDKVAVDDSLQRE